MNSPCDCVADRLIVGGLRAPEVTVECSSCGAKWEVPCDGRALYFGDA